MILATRYGNREVRDLFSGADAIPRPSEFYGGQTWAGRPVGVSEAAGLPAVMRAISLLAETTGQLPCKVFRDVTNGREEARDSDQWRLLHERPNEAHTPYNFFSYIVASLSGWGNAYILKVKSRAAVEGLYPLDPWRMKVKVERGEISYEYREDKNKVVMLTTSDLIHVRNKLLGSRFVGVSPIELHRNVLSSAIGQEEHVARFFANDASPGGIITVAGNLRKEQRQEIKETWDAQHRGSGNAHRLGILWGNAEYQQVAVSPEAAQLIESRKFTVQDVARMFGIPSGLLNDTEAPGSDRPDLENQRFFTLGLAPVLTNLQQAFHTDDDLFPDKGLRPEFIPAALLQADILTRYDAYRLGRQGGWVTANEIRDIENLPPVENGDELQVTPVGGAPNTNTAPTRAREDKVVVHNHTYHQHQIEIPGIDSVAGAIREQKPSVVNVENKLDLNGGAEKMAAAWQAGFERLAEVAKQRKPAVVNVEPQIDVRTPDVHIDNRAPKPTGTKLVRDKKGRTTGTKLLYDD